MQKKPYSLAHFSDSHILSLKGASWQELFSKRIYGLFSKFKGNKGIIDYNKVFKYVADEFRQIRLDRIVFTGDLTHLSLNGEFILGKNWLDRLQKYAKIFLVLGNHDQYISRSADNAFRILGQYMNIGPAAEYSDNYDCFPSLVFDDPVALIGLNTAIACPLFFAYGKIGEAQLTRLEKLLEGRSGKDVFKILVMHHPPDNRHISRRRGLLDSEMLLAVLKRHPVHMILHGHTHKHGIHSLDSSLSTKVFEASSVAALKKVAEKRPCINFFQIVSLGDNTWKVDLTVKTYSRGSNRFACSLKKEYLLKDVLSSN
jgi:3',5'-cyclic AMP phosphodiesterase CpdA